jgi:hypothetical protein
MCGWVTNTNRVRYSGWWLLGVNERCKWRGQQYNGSSSSRSSGSCGSSCGSSVVVVVVVVVAVVVGCG